LETIERDYGSRGVQFFYIYKALAHPENSGYIQPFTLDERLMHVKEANRTLGSRIPWICDSMQNEIKHALGDAPNSEFILDPEGRVVRKRGWSNPSQVRKDLEELIGPVDNPTRVADLDLKMQPPPKVAARGVVERVERPQNLQAIWVEPEVKEKGKPFYAKLRAEAEPNLIRSGSGKLYLGLHLDPLYHVHWNNLTKPIKVRLTAPDGTELSSTTLDGPKVDEPADIDPREFLIDVTSWPVDTPIKVTVDYFACNDEQGWCLAIQQKYELIRIKDPDAGWIQRNAGRGQGRAGQPSDPQRRPMD
jgi:hypothetical protein